MFFNFLKRRESPKSRQVYPYESTVEMLNESKYCLVNENEYEFIKLLFKKFESESLTGRIELQRMSSRALDFRYCGYPVGKVKLNGDITWFMYLENLYDIKQIENISSSNYYHLIGHWIRYIRVILKIRN